MNFARAIAQTVEGIPGVISPDHMDEGEVQALADAMRAVLREVEDELLNRLVARTSCLPANFPWPDSASDPRALALPFALEPQA